MRHLKIAIIAAMAALIPASAVAQADAHRDRRPVVRPWWSHRILGPGSDYFYGTHPYPAYGAISGIYTGDPGVCYVPRTYPWGVRLQFVC